MMRTNLYFRIICFITILFVNTATIVPPIADKLAAGRLTCEYIQQPLGINTKQPRLSWNIFSQKRGIVQTAYEIIVSDNLADIRNVKGNVWASGKILSNEMLLIPYEGRSLSSFTRYYWRVRVYGNDDKASPWSDVTWFETAMMADNEWKAKWIGDDLPEVKSEADHYNNDPMPLFRKSFHVRKKPLSARLYVSGAGYYEAYLNGEKVGDHVLDPGWTNYNKEIQYAVYDVSKQVKSGENVTGLMVGNGWYNPLPMRMWSWLNIRESLAVGRPAVKAQLRISYTDGSVETIITDASWQMLTGPIVRNSVYLGEHYDARMEKEGWVSPGVKYQEAFKEAVNAKEVEGPAGIMTPQMQPPIRVTKVLKPISVNEVKPGVFVFDMGQNFAGAIRVRVQGPSGNKVVFRYGEDIYKDGNINVMTAVAGQIKAGNGGSGAPKVAWQEDSYTLKGSGLETWQPRFTFHGFRYVEVSGWPGKPSLQDIDGLRMNTDVEENGQFASGDAMFNKLNDVIQWTFLSNIFSVQSDCPAREKFGYGGDIFGTSEAYLYNYNMYNFYRKAIADFKNDQRPLGGIPETAPFVGIADRGPGDKSGPLGWQLAYPYLIKQIHDFYADKQIVAQNYEALKKQITFLDKTSSPDGLFFNDISDHEALDTKPEALTAAAFYYHHLLLMQEFAAIVNDREGAHLYEERANRVKKAIIARYLVAGTGRFDNSTQTAQIFALYYNLAEGKEKDAAFEVLLNEFSRHSGHLSTGIFATKMMFDVLRNADKNEVAMGVASKKDFPGWGHMLQNGATTLWETWAYSDNVYSQNHPMFGSVGEWFYRSLLGINAAAPGFQKIIIKPQPAGDLLHAKGAYLSVSGRIASEWHKTSDQFTLKMEVPANTTAEVWLPVENEAKVYEGGVVVETSSAVKAIKKTAKHCVLTVGSGSYVFEVK